MFHQLSTTRFTQLDILLRIADKWTVGPLAFASLIGLSGAGRNDSGAAADAASYLMGGSKFPRKGNKYNAKKTTIGKITFDSGREAARYLALVEMEKAGEINHLQIQPRFRITIGGIPIMMRSKRYPNGRQLTYVSDFTYLDVQNQEKVIEDVKGQRTDVYKIKLALMQAMGYRVKEV